MEHKDDRLAPLYQLALTTGLRLGEALGLRWEDIDLQARTLSVRFALQRVEGRLQLVEPKTDRSRRTLPLPDSLIPILRAHRHRQLEERMAAGDKWQEHSLVFTTTIGTPIDGVTVLHRFQDALKRAGLPRKRFHDLRHSCASLLLAQGVPARTVMEMLGHSQISLTMNTYAHVMPEMLRGAADLMDSILTAQK